MADIVASRTVNNSPRYLTVIARIDSDGTGSTDAVLVDKSAFTGPDGTEPSKFSIDKIEYNCDGMQVALEFDHDTDDHIANLAAQGELDFSKSGKQQGLHDPASAGGTGDIVATTVGHTAGDKATIVLHLRKHD